MSLEKTICLKKSICLQCNKVKMLVHEFEKEWSEGWVWCPARIKDAMLMGLVAKAYIDKPPPKECFYLMEQVIA